MPTAAAIDVGTNTIKLIVGQKVGSNPTTILYESVITPRLGEGIDASGEISERGCERVIQAINRLLVDARSYGAEVIRMVATSAVRDARNQSAVVARIEGECGEAIDVLSEQDEARFSYEAVALDPIVGIDTGAQLVVDVGGGSTELAFGEGKIMRYGVSVRTGAVRLSERWLASDPPTVREMNDAAADAEASLRNAVGTRHASRIVGVGGSAAGIGRIIHGVAPKETTRVHGAVVNRKQLISEINHLCSIPLRERRNVFGLEPERADIILGGAIVLDRILDIFALNAMIISTRGLRHGVLYDLLAG